MRLGAAPSWLRRFLLAAVISGFAVLADTSLEKTSLYREIGAGAFALQQYGLQDAARSAPPPPVVVVDLESMIAVRPNSTVHSDPEHADAELAPQWAALKMGLTRILAAKPRAVFIDWELGLGTDFVDGNQRSFAYRPEVTERTRRAYDGLMRALQSSQATCPVLFVADHASARNASGGAPFPVAGLETSAVRAAEYRPDVGPYVGSAPIGGTEDHGEGRAHGGEQGPDGAPMGEPFPLATDAAVIHRLGLSDRLHGRETRAFFFSAETHSETGPRFWLDLARLPRLLDTAIFEPLDRLSTSSTQARLRDRIVMIADVRGVGDDRKLAPFRLEERPRESGVLRERDPVGGGVLTALAWLTRSESPVYSIPHGLKSWLFLWGFSLVTISLAHGLGHLLTRGGESDRHEMTRHVVDILVTIIFPVLSVLMWVRAVPLTHVLFIGFPIWVMTRLIDLLIAILQMAWHLRHPSEGHPSGNHAAESSALSPISDSPHD